jgi:hypothetical protein
MPHFDANAIYKAIPSKPKKQRTVAKKTMEAAPYVIASIRSIFRANIGNYVRRCLFLFLLDRLLLFRFR